MKLIKLIKLIHNKIKTNNKIKIKILIALL
jgi:hypothetical protein